MLFSIALYQRNIYIGILYLDSNQKKLYVLSKSESVKFSLIHRWKNIFHC